MLNPFKKFTHKQLRDTLLVFWLFTLISGKKIWKATPDLQAQFLNEIGIVSVCSILPFLLWGEGAILLSLPMLTYLSFRWRRKLKSIG